MQIRSLLLAFVIIAGANASAQPDPTQFYPKRIEEINKKLAESTNNYQLIWERLRMSVTLLYGDQFYFVFYHYPDHPDCIKNDCSGFEKDFETIYNNVIKAKNFSYVEEGDFYICRMQFYGKTLQVDKAIRDAIYLRDNASHSKYWQRGDYYNDWAIESLFRLYVMKKDYWRALDAINDVIRKEKATNSDKYYRYENNYSNKIKLFEHFGHSDQIVPYLKELCRENFDFYFREVAKNKQFEGHYAKYDAESYSYYLKSIKQQGYAYLKEILIYTGKYDTAAVSRYRDIFNRLRNPVNDYIIDERINDVTLKEIVLSI